MPLLIPSLALALPLAVLAVAARTAENRVPVAPDWTPTTAASTGVGAAAQQALLRSGVASHTACAILELPAARATTGVATPLFLWREAVPVKPASNMKLLTTGAALSALGTDFRFRTRLLLDRAAKSDPLRPITGPRVIVVGDGDPALGDPEALASMRFLDSDGSRRSIGRPEELLDLWISDLRSRGVASITELIVDPRVFDREAYHPAWPTDGQSLRPYCAEVWGLNFHANSLRVVAKGESVGPLRGFALVPDYPDIRARNRATVVAGRTKSTFVVTRSPGANDVVLSGRIPSGRIEDMDLSIHDPPTLFAGLFAARLAHAGIAVGEARAARPDDPMPAGEVVAIIETPIAIVAGRANTDSSNLHAECLLKRLAAESALRRAAGAQVPPLGSWSSGAAVVHAMLGQRLGAEAAAPFVVSDGSGLSHDNRVTAGGLAAWIASLAADPAAGDAFIASLARAGVSGTVARRFAAIKESPVAVHCKTGYILGVSSLSGVAIAPDGRRVAFSIIGNDLAQGDRVARARALQEAIVVEIVRSLETAARGIATEPTSP